MINKGIEQKKKEYNQLLARYYKADKWFYEQPDTYFDSVEGKKEYKAFIGIISRLKDLYNDIEGY